TQIVNEEKNAVRQEFNFEKARLEVHKFGITGYKKQEQRVWEQERAIMLGAKPPKKAHMNYRTYQEKLKEKKAAKDADKEKVLEEGSASRERTKRRERAWRDQVPDKMQKGVFLEPYVFVCVCAHECKYGCNAEQWKKVSGAGLQQIYLDVSIEAQCRHEDTLDVLKCWRPLLLPIYVKGQVVLVQIQENTNGGTFRNSSFGPKCMNQLRLLSTYMAHALSSLPSIMSLTTLILAMPKAGSGTNARGVESFDSGIVSAVEMKAIDGYALRHSLL
ncbi:hypothetical protein IHE44_0009204, partial [Lamprotornis superbus]